ncbi:uncharacterized protein LOC117801181 [Ailuropoda melanoleuca]|uniref:uncharacterized protein LOC117801181 n=1 Tax=Ailuropoda melanoleuca TaxID=9646 RepID=UPI0014947770|nr:uncharacterized protein LOC117801181 [Ailuropoda melanoleuca]
MIWPVWCFCDLLSHSCSLFSLCSSHVGHPDPDGPLTFQACHCLRAFVLAVLSARNILPLENHIAQFLASDRSWLRGCIFSETFPDYPKYSTTYPHHVRLLPFCPACFPFLRSTFDLTGCKMCSSFVFIARLLPLYEGRQRDLLSLLLSDVSLELRRSLIYASPHSGPTEERPPAFSQRQSEVIRAWREEGHVERACSGAGSEAALGRPPDHCGDGTSCRALPFPWTWLGLCLLPGHTAPPYPRAASRSPLPGESSLSRLPHLSLKQAQPGSQKGGG